ncbi:Alkaline phosphatase synthesis transcriptional regulatory protein PhoP [Bacillus sp. THAF10]|uniref:response regulator transcription factor n=1 Tax=Bacillus sp. THAF10 TaxID=2587848 RepID=UPI001268EA18|nr:response regulator transcription factor [Bacillus sp. THAF10]QFT88183.1 Alkaline phosphatase synthesis transcriptional regulatory protein PhoP [Bacillus sp. THAF10]
MKKLFKVLVIEDDPNIAELISLYIEKEGFSIEIAWDGEEGLGKYYEVSPDFVILDIMLPGMDGFEICKEIRRDNSGIPIIMLTGKGESYDKIRGFGLGVDDYMVKPFDPNELIARVKAVLRRSNPSSLHEVVNIPGITINMNEYKVYVNNAEITMPPKELELLYFFVVNKNQVFTRQQLLDNIWGYDYDGDSRTIDVHIKRIREKLEEQSERWNLRTIRGIGYKLEVKESD